MFITSFVDLSNSHDSLRRMLTKTITDDVAARYSSLGRRGKKNSSAVTVWYILSGVYIVSTAFFTYFRVYVQPMTDNLVSDVLVKQCPGAIMPAAENTVKCWLKEAPKRLKQREAIEI